MKYRSRTEIVGNILDAANGGTTKTKIMYKAFLSYGQVKRISCSFDRKNLIEYFDGTHKFKTTKII
jgi:predicted transcriptional regulator